MLKAETVTKSIYEGEKQNRFSYLIRFFANGKHKLSE